VAKRRGLRVCQQLGALGSLLASRDGKRRLRPLPPVTVTVTGAAVFQEPVVM